MYDSDKILKPFMELAEVVPDLNDKRAKREGACVFTEWPNEWLQDFPRIIIQSEDMVPQEVAGQFFNDTTYGNYLTYDIKISYLTRQAEEYLCPDGVVRKNKAVIEYMLMKWLLPIISKQKVALMKKYCFFDLINLNRVTKVYEVENYGLGVDIILNVTSKIRVDEPLANDSYISGIDVGISGVSGDLQISGV